MITPQDLRIRRLHLGMSRDQLAHTLGVALDDVADWEEGSAPIACPAALEQILRRRETAHSQRSNEEVGVF